MNCKDFIAIAVLSCAASLDAANVAVINPPNDAIVMTAATTVTGVATVTNAKTVVLTRVSAEGTVRKEATVDPVTSTWAVPDFPLARGFNKIAVDTVPASGPPSLLFVTRGDVIGPRPVQLVTFAWDDDVDEELEGLARGTLDAGLTDQQVKTFVKTVRARTRVVFERAYFNIPAVQFVDADGSAVHVVRFTGVDSDFFGLSPADCGNQVPKQESTVFVGTYRTQIVNAFDEWKPMKKSDSLETRAQDIAEALGRTAAHETGHSLGLVADNGPCDWMSGCDGFHSCFMLQQINAGLARFGGGFFIMDPGNRSANRARIAEQSPDVRAVRQPATFCTFDRNYLTAIAPTQ